MQRAIKGFSNYSITEKGDVFNLTSGKQLQVFLAKGSKAVTVTNDDGRRLTKAVSGLVKVTFPELFEVKLENIVTHTQGDLSKALVTVSDEVQELQANFTYDPETGIVIKTTTGNLGWLEEQGYRVFDWKGNSVKAHRLIFLLVLGFIPEGTVDHINHNRDDNRWINLRVVSKSTNAKNLSKYTTNSSGVTGVSWHKGQQKWVARIMVNRKAIQLGSFATKEEAVDVRRAALIKYNFHENHGVK